MIIEFSLVVLPSETGLTAEASTLEDGMIERQVISKQALDLVALLGGERADGAKRATWPGEAAAPHALNVVLSRVLRAPAARRGLR